MAYERVSGPLGGRRIDLATALICAVLANVNKDSKSKAFEVDDFMPDWAAEQVESSTPDQIWSEVERAHAALTKGR